MDRKVVGIDSRVHAEITRFKQRTGVGMQRILAAAWRAFRRLPDQQKLALIVEPEAGETQPTA